MASARTSIALRSTRSGGRNLLHVAEARRSVPASASAAQFARDAQPEPTKETSAEPAAATRTTPDRPTGRPDPGGETAKTAPKLARFHGSVGVDPLRLGRDAARIAEEVVQHLSSLVGANVEI